MELIISQIKKSCREISDLLRVHLPNKNNLTNTTNSSNDTVNKIDLVSNEIIKKNLSICKEIRCIGSEEEENLVELNISGKYFVAFDPLDGSKNIDVNLPTGTIFGIYSLEEKGSLHLLNGNDIVYAGYCLYSSATILVETYKKTKMSILMNGNYHLIEDNILMPNKGKTYSINEGNKKYWNDMTKKIVKRVNMDGVSLRYDGCLVADVHRILMNGGLFMYPEDLRNPNGKLRLIYEVWPMAYVANSMGAHCYGAHRMNNLFELGFPGNIHQKVQLFICGEYENKKYM